MKNIIFSELFLLVFYIPTHKVWQVCHEKYRGKMIKFYETNVSSTIAKYLLFLYNDESFIVKVEARVKKLGFLYISVG